MILIFLFKRKKKPTEEVPEEFERRSDELIKEYGITSIGRYWVLDQNDSVGIFEAPDAATMMRFNVAAPTPWSRSHSSPSLGRMS